MRMTDLDRIARQQENPRAVSLWLALQPLRSCVSFMNTGAHPDDETSVMLAALGLRDGVKLSHACSTRGEGGQNALGLEVAKDLGVVRTREMERAAKVLNMTHYWLSETPDDTIFDFGFSKSGDETLQYWDEQRTLKRFVQILRRERPDIVCPTFLDVPGQHGHHRAMTQSAFKAVKLAADADAFPELELDTWQVKKIYLPAWSGAGDAYDDDVPPPPETTRIDGSGEDPVLGADYAQIGQWSRAFHRTQGMGSWIEPGRENVWPLNLAWSARGEPGNEASIFTDLPQTLADLAVFADAKGLAETLFEAQTQLVAAISAWPDDKKIANHANEALRLIRRAQSDCPQDAKAEILHRLATKERELCTVLSLSAKISCRVSVSQQEIRPGQKLVLTLNLHSPEIAVTPEVILPVGWRSGPWLDNKCEILVPANAKPSDPYPDTWYPDRANASLHVKLTWQQGGQDISICVDPEETLQILPARSADLSSSAALVNLSAPASVSVAVSGINPTSATPQLSEQEGWDISLEGGEFLLSPAANLKAGLYEFELSLDGQTAAAIHRMGYEHTGPLVRTEKCIFSVRVLDVELPDVKVAYIGGGSDRTDHWLRAVGMNVTSLEDHEIEQTDFSEFDSVLIGIFAFRARPALASRIKALHDWVHAGGNLVTLYHRPWDNWDAEKTPLARLEIGKPSLRWRVTNQNATVTHLEPDHPLLNVPNKIAQDDWQSWQKERGLYFASDWDAVYQPLLSMADQSEESLFGSLLSAKFGRGRHTHTSLILHYQLEKLVPGAYRLLANLLNSA